MRKKRRFSQKLLGVVHRLRTPYINVAQGMRGEGADAKKNVDSPHMLLLPWGPTLKSGGAGVLMCDSPFADASDVFFARDGNTLREIARSYNCKSNV